MQELVSVVIPTHNSSVTIRACISSILRQTYSNIEVIVVDNHSLDQTVEAVQAMGATCLQGGPERSAQVNVGACMARGKYVYRVDSDFVVDNEVVEECVEACEVMGFDGIAVHNVSDSSVSYWSRVRKLERNVLRGNDRNDAVRFVLRDVWVKLGGLDEDLIAGEDYDFHDRFVKSGHKFGFVESKETHLNEPRTLADIAVKNYYYGKTIVRYVRKRPLLASKKISPLRIFSSRNREFFTEPKTVFGFGFYQFVKYSAAFLGIVFSAAMLRFAQEPSDRIQARKRLTQ